MKVIAAIVIVCTLVACSGKKESPISEKELATKPFKRAALTFHIGKVGRGYSCDDSGAAPSESIQYIAAEKLGFITIKPEGKNLWKVDLTDLGQSKLKEGVFKKPYGHEVEKNCDTEQVSFDIASGKLVKITDSVENDDTAVVSYIWKWASTETGTKLTQFDFSPKQKDDLISYIAGYELPGKDHFTLPVDELEHSGKIHYEKKDRKWKPVKIE